MSDLSVIVAPMEKDSPDRVLSPRAALLVCAVAAILGWIGVAGAIYVGKSLIGGWQDLDTASEPVSQIAPAAGPQGLPASR
jgi:hypothetical protein